MLKLFNKHTKEQEYSRSERNKSQILLIKKISSLVLKVSTLDEVVETALKLICVHIGWPIGHAYYVEAAKDEESCPELVPTKFWYIQHPKKYASFRVETDRVNLMDCAGLPGKVLSEGEANWVNIPSRDDPRIETISELGLNFSFAFPIIVSGKAIAVLEFFDIYEENSTEEIMATMGHIGEMLGYLIENQWSAQSMKESEAKFFSIFESSSDAIIISSKEGDILGANSAAIEMFEYQKKNILEQNYFNLFYPDYKEEWHSALKKAEIGTKVGVLQSQGLSQEGDKFPVSLTISRWVRGLSTFYYTIVRNLSETEKNLSLLQATLEATQDGILALDNDGKVVAHNTAFLSIWEVPPDIIEIGSSLIELKRKLSAKVKDVDYFNKNVFQLQGIIGTRQEIIELKSGKQIEKQSTSRIENGEVVGRVYSFHDITHRNLYLNTLAESEELFRRTFEEANIGIAHVSLGGTFLRVNARLAQMLNYEQKELQKKSFQEITHPADLKEDLDLLSDLLEGKIEEYSIKKRYFTKEGEVIWIRLRVSLLKDTKEVPQYFISMIEKLDN